MCALFVELSVNSESTVQMFHEKVSNLRVVHGEHPLWLLAVGQAGLPQLLVYVQIQHDPCDLSVPLPHTVELLQLQPVRGVKVSVESCLDAINHILHSELSEIWQKKRYNDDNMYMNHV